jgi:uncharacterized membrane protein YbhN (UPF0104 family)
MRLFGVPPEAAAGATLLIHALQVLPVILVGLISALVTSINIMRVSYDEGDRRLSTA